MRNPNTICHFCNKPCYVRPNQLDKQQVWFCSKECHNEHRRINLSSRCQQCSEPFARSNAGQKFCSRACSNKGRAGIKYDGANRANNATIVARRRQLVIDTYGPNCSICQGEPVWMNQTLQHQVDHIDGNNKNNELTNLRMLCPNCHTQTPTYGAKNIKYQRENGKFSA